MHTIAKCLSTEYWGQYGIWAVHPNQIHIYQIYVSSVI